MFEIFAFYYLFIVLHFFLTFGILLSFSNIKEFVAIAIACVITYMTNSVLMDFEY